MEPASERTVPRGLGLWAGALFLALALGVAAAATIIELPSPAVVVTGIGVSWILLGVTTVGRVDTQIKAGIQHHASGDIAVFTLGLDQERVILEPGKTWSQLDHFKWVMRGLIEEPQMLHVFPDGSVEINSEKISITDHAAAEKLEHQITKRHTPTGGHKTPEGPTSKIGGGAAAPGTSDSRRLRVKLDHFGHVVIERGHGAEREETGLRGISTLIANGLIRKPDQYRVDPMQRSIEIDGVKFECNEAGVKQLEEALNGRYAPRVQAQTAMAIEIKENLAASAGFDIHFQTAHAGVVREIKGHLSQELLDLLQDPQKCDLLRPGIHLLLSPPYLLIRRRQPDLREEKIPELPDLNVLRSSAAQLQAVFNHPLVSRNAGAAATPALQAATDRAAEIVGIRLARNPQDKVLLWLECITTGGAALPAKAFTHHNVAELQQSGIFHPHLDVHLSLDHRRLTIQNRETREEEILTLDTQSPHEDLCHASRRLTNALKPRRPGVGNEPVAPLVLPAGDPPASVEKKPAARQPAAAPPRTATATGRAIVGVSAAPTGAQPGLDPAITELFRETDAVRINLGVFRRLGPWLGITPQDVRLSLPFVFENRRFEVLSFEHQEIADLSQLRSVEFYGFYLSHVSEKRILLIYACNGMHIEWGPEKCVLQATAQSEPKEYRGSVLLGLAQNNQNEFVFVVPPEFKQWIAPRETPFTEENLQFLTVADMAAAPGDFKFIWPERPAAPR